MNESAELAGDGAATREIARTVGCTIGRAQADVIVNYTMTSEDAAYEFVPRIPADYAEQAKMKRLGYVSAQEMLAERFHMDTDLLAALNPGVALDQQGANVKVLAAQRPKPQRAVRLDANKSRGLLIVYGSDDTVLASFPATIGSERTPTPSGELTVTRVAHNPPYQYDPEKNFQQGKNKGRLTLPAGPNIQWARRGLPCRSRRLAFTVPQSRPRLVRLSRTVACDSPIGIRPGWCRW